MTESLKLGPDTTVSLATLTIQLDGEEFTVGRASTLSFVRLDAEAVNVLDYFEEGVTLDQVRRRLVGATGEDVDVVDFATALLEAGLVATVDGRALQPEPEVAVRTTLSAIGRVLFGRRIRWAYLGAVVAAAVILAIRPDLRPTPDDAFALPSPTLSLLLLFIVSLGLTVVHELGHVVAAASVGVGARLRLSTRLTWVVAETDLSGLWSVERGPRLLAFAAGSAWDGVILLGALLVRTVAPLDSLLSAGAAVVAVILVYRTAWQLLIFLRTDLYFILALLADSGNLGESSRLWLRSLVPHAGRQAKVSLASVPGRERRAAAWFGTVSVLGAGVAAVLFVTYQVPIASLALGKAFAAVTTGPAASAEWVDGAVTIAVASFEVGLWLAAFSWATVARRRQAIRQPGT